jgi:hypothetical protein
MLRIAPTSPQLEVDFGVDDYRKKLTKRQSQFGAALGFGFVLTG